MRKSRGLRNLFRWNKLCLFTSRILLSSNRKVKIGSRKKRNGGLLFLKILLVGIFFLPFFRTVPQEVEPVQIIETKDVPNPVSIFDKDGNLLFKDTVGSVSTYKRAPHVVDFVLRQLSSQLKKEKINEGLLIKTGIDLDLQNYVQQVLLEGSFDFKEKTSGSAVIVVRPKDGGVLAMVGSTNYYAENGAQNNIFTQRRFKISDKNFEMSLWDLARVYSVFANSGKFVDFSIISSIQDNEGENVSVGKDESLHLIEEMYKIMTTDKVSNTGVRIFDSDFESLSQVAISFSDDYIVGVWSEKDGSGKSLLLDILQKIVAKTGSEAAKGGDI